MSYILDALKKADSERQHGKTPDIYTQQPRSNELDSDKPIWKNPMLWFFLVVVAIMLGAFVYLNNWRRVSPGALPPPAQITPAPVTSVAPSTAATQNAPTASSEVAASPTAEVAPVAASVAQPLPPSATEAPIPATQPEPVKLQPSTKLSVHAKNDKKSSASAAPSATSPRNVAAKQESKPPAPDVTKTLRDLPTNIQSEIPPITVGGYIYSDNKAECQLLINKLLLHEGEQVSPGLILEKMMAHSAILNYKGYRYRISY